MWISVRLKSSLEEALASNREQASDFAKLQDELRKTRSSLQVYNKFSNWICNVCFHGSILLLVQLGIFLCLLLFVLYMLQSNGKYQIVLSGKIEPHH